MDAYAWLLIIALVVGTMGTFVPMMPGIWLMFISLLIYGYFDNWVAYSVWFVAVVFGLSVLSSCLDFGGAMIGSKKFGASSKSALGAMAGSFIGGFFFKLPGTFFGGVLGAIALEYQKNKSIKKALKAAAGSFIGNAIGSSVQLVMALAITVYAIIRLRGIA